MTSGEFEGVLVAAQYALRYHDSNPDVGMGPTSRMIVDEVLQQTSIEANDGERDAVAERLDAWQQLRHRY